PAPASHAANLPDKLPPAYLVKTQRLLTSSGEFARGMIHVVNGRLASPGAVDPGLPVFDLGDTPVTPGFVAGHLAFAADTAPDADASQHRAADGLALDDARIKACRDAGFLNVVVAPGSNNVLAGTSGLVRASDNEVPDVALKFVLTGT